MRTVYGTYAEPGGVRPWLMMWNNDRMLFALMAARQAVTTLDLAVPTARGEDTEHNQQGTGN
jgi:hypothetical protein